jgi:hypothetical protein
MVTCLSVLQVAFRDIRPYDSNDNTNRMTLADSSELLLTASCDLVSPTHWPHFTPPVLISVRD